MNTQYLNNLAFVMDFLANKISGGFTTSSNNDRLEISFNFNHSSYTIQLDKNGKSVRLNEKDICTYELINKFK